MINNYKETRNNKKRASQANTSKTSKANKQTEQTNKQPNKETKKHRNNERVKMCQQQTKLASTHTSKQTQTRHTALQAKQ